MSGSASQSSPSTLSSQSSESSPRQAAAPSPAQAAAPAPGWRFLRTRRWAAYLAITVLFAIACGFLGNWQFDRRAQARAEIDRIDNNYDAPPVPIQQALPTPETFDEATQKWLPVLANGTYLTEQQTLVRIRPRNGNPGFEVVVPFLTDEGTVFMVNRGWLPTGTTQDAPDTVPPAPGGRVQIVARLKAGEPALPTRTAGPGQIATINLAELANRVAQPSYTAAYGVLASETPESNPAPLRAERPERNEGPHLSYAVQWYVFALMAFFGLGWAAKQEYRVLNAAEPPEQERAEKRAARAARRSNDADEEDALLDASTPAQR